MNKIEFGNCTDIMQKWIDEGVKVNTCVTSPPYYGLRDYGTATWEGGYINCDHKEYLGGHGEASKLQKNNKGTQQYNYRDVCKKCGAKRVDEQIGLEETPKQYIDNMVKVFRSVKELLTDDGTLWVNIGDSYAGNCSRASNNGRAGFGNKRETVTNRMSEGIKQKDLIGIPWMLAFALREDGWYLRQDIIWHKPNPMPESVKDRCTKSHEYIFLLSKSPKYYFDNEAIKEPSVYFGKDKRSGLGNFRYEGKRTKDNESKGQQSFVTVNETRNKRDVWSVNVKPYKGAHFATFPMELIEPCIKAGCPDGGIVLDPFMGSGTTAQVALINNKQYLGCELNKDYKNLQDERIPLI